MSNKKFEMEALGKHILVELLMCKPEILNDVSIIETGMVDAATYAGATVINSTFHHFSPYGVSGVVVIQESHLAIHTWPEYRHAAVDLFTCGNTVDPWLSFDHLKKILHAKNYSALEMKRGALNLLQRVDFDVSYMRETAKKRVQYDKFKRNVWFTDKDENQALSLRYSGDILYNKSSEYQKVKVIETYAYGKTLIIDNMMMCTEKDEQHYHEMISHPAILTHGNVKKVLVIGGGDGGTIREVLKHDKIEKVVMVEIDKNVIEASKLHLPTLSDSLNHPRLDIKIKDGIKYVANLQSEAFDLIIVDSTDPVGPAKGLFSADFYNNCKRILASDGLLVTQGESPMFNREVFVKLNSCLKDVFGKEKVETLLFHIPSYPSGIWSVHMAAKGNVKPENVDSGKIAIFEQKNELHYYNHDVHRAALALPNYVKKLLRE